MKHRRLCFRWALATAAAAALAAGCASAPPPTPAERPADPELARLAAAARGQFARGAPETAAALYRQALVRARAADHAVEIGNAAYNLGACLVALERYAEARASLKEARAEFARAGRPVADILLLDATAARLAGDGGEALALAEGIAAAAPRNVRAGYAVQAALLRAQVACDRGDAAAARAELDKAASAPSGTPIEAEIAGVSARVLQLEKNASAAAAEYDRQAELYRAARNHRAMAQALGRAAAAWAAAGDAAGAAERYHRAARSLFAQGDAAGALKLVEPGLAAADKAGDRAAAEALAALFREIRAAVENAAPAGAP